MVEGKVAGLVGGTLNSVELGRSGVTGVLDNVEPVAVTLELGLEKLFAGKRNGPSPRATAGFYFYVASSIREIGTFEKVESGVAGRGGLK